MLPLSPAAAASPQLVQLGSWAAATKLYLSFFVSTSLILRCPAHSMERGLRVVADV
jgi:hypothetical protein